MKAKKYYQARPKTWKPSIQRNKSAERRIIEIPEKLKEYIN